MTNTEAYELARRAVKIRRPKSMSRKTWRAGLLNGMIADFVVGDVHHYGLWTFTRVGDTAWIVDAIVPSWRAANLTSAGRAVAQIVETEILRVYRRLSR